MKSPDHFDHLAAGIASLERRDPERVAAENCGLVCLGDVERADAIEHFRNAADLVRIVAARQNMIDSGESDGQF